MLAVVHAVWLAFAMFGAILWTLILGFTISGVVHAVAPKQQTVNTLGAHRLMTLMKTCGLGAAPSEGTSVTTS